MTAFATATTSQPDLAACMAHESRPPSPPDPARRMEELGRIILAYSEVTERLQQSHDQLHHTVQSLRRELGEKDRMLERKNRLAALGEMAAGLAHEIRNPLGGIQLYASLLRDDLRDRPDSLCLVNKIAGGVKRLESLVGQVLQFTREITAHCAPADLAAVVEQAVEYATAVMNARCMRCQVQGPASLTVHADALLIGQAVLNLVLNAAEATAEAHARVAGGAVVVRYGPPPSGSDARQFHLAVQDSGPGIPPDVMDRIFNPFFTTKETGTGLGLAIVHRIVEAHDGTILVTNPPEGGARFEIRV
jgi:signal transduction histidine kinase